MRTLGIEIVRQTHLATRLVLLISAATLIGAAALIGAPGLALAGPCEVTPTGGTVMLPPDGCDYLSPDEVHMIIDGLPPGTTIELAPIHKDFICHREGLPQGPCSIAIPPGECEAPGGSLGGKVDCTPSTVELQVTGTGALTGFSRVLSLPLEMEVHTAPRTPGNAVQSFDTEMVQLQGQLFGDPDFDLLIIQAGSGFGLPSPGHTTLTRLPNGNFNVDSFFDITYTISFQGAPGSVLAGAGGVTTGTIKMAAGVPAPDNPCVVPDDGTGTVVLPPPGCEYLSPDEVHEIINGLPPGTKIVLSAIHKDFICGGPAQGACSVVLPPGECEGAGGSLGGSVDCFESSGEITVTGTGALAGFQRTLLVPLGAEIHTGPRVAGDPVQSFPNEMMRLEGALFGDPDFCQLSVSAGSNFGLPSPGHTTLTRLGPPGSDFQVDSFFDITYTIDFTGCPGSALDGLAGSTTATLRMQTGTPTAAAPGLSRPAVMLFVGLIAASGVVIVMRRRLAAA